MPPDLCPGSVCIYFRFTGVIVLGAVVVGLTRTKIDNYCLHNINISRQGCLRARRRQPSRSSSSLSLSRCLCVCVPFCIVSFVNKIARLCCEDIRTPCKLSVCCSAACVFIFLSHIQHHIPKCKDLDRIIKSPLVFIVSQMFT